MGDFSQSRQMKDYVQTQRNCGAVAALFAVYGPNKKVADADLGILESTSWSSASIEREINARGKKFGVRAGANGPAAKVAIGTKAVSLEDFLHKQFRAEVREKTTGGKTQQDQLTVYRSILERYMTQLVHAYKARCVIVSGQSSTGWHWQTFYTLGKALKIFNGRENWIPELIDGMGPGVVAVRGAAIC